MVTAAVGLACLIVGLFVSLLVIHHSKGHWLLVGQQSGEALHGRGPEGWNRTELPPRRRSPDHQLVDRQITRTRERPPLPRR